MILLPNYLAFWTPGPFEIIAILVVALLLFGRRLPETARSLGKSLTEFKRGMKETTDDVENALHGDESNDQARQQTGQNQD